MKKTPDDILARVSTLNTGDSSKDVYDDWAATYDEHLGEAFGYVSPRLSAAALAELCPDTSIRIVDYGCGTGLVGEALFGLGFADIHGVDISSGMLAQAARKGVYRSLSVGDLTRPPALEDDHFAAGLCIGSMGAGHIDADHVPNLLKPIRPGGVFVIYMNAAYYESGGFARKFRQLEADGEWIILRQESSNYMDKLDRPGWLLVARKAEG